MLFDAIVIGGGPAGATTALLLARAGWAVALVEKKAFPRRKVCGEFISATNLPLLKELGIADYYLAHGGPPVQRVGLFAGNTVINATMPCGDNSAGKWGHALGREYLDTLLLEQARLAGAKIWQPWSVMQFEKQGHYYKCILTQKEKTEEILGQMIILANGSWEKSLVQKSTSLHKPTDFLGFKAHFTKCDLAIDLMPLLVFPGGYGGMVHTDNGRVTLSCGVIRKTLQQLRKLHPGLSAGDAVACHIISTCKGAADVLLNAQREGQWLSVGPLRPGIRPRYTEGVFFVGNSAGEAHPIVAEGISMALQSAWLLAHLLIGMQKEGIKHTLIDVGKEYAKKWHSHCAPRIHAAHVFTQIAIRPQVVAFLLPLFKRFPGLISYGAKLSGKVRALS